MWPQRDRLRKTGAFSRGMSVQAFFVENDRDPQAGILKEEPLNVVGELRHGARVFAAAGIAGPSHLSQTAAVAKCFLRLLQIEIAFGVDECIGLLLPDAHHLGSLLFQRHALQQILCALGR